MRTTIGIGAALMLACGTEPTGVSHDAGPPPVDAGCIEFLGVCQFDAGPCICTMITESNYGSCLQKTDGGLQGYSPECAAQWLGAASCWRGNWGDGTCQ